MSGRRGAAHTPAHGPGPRRPGCRDRPARGRQRSDLGQRPRQREPARPRRRRDVLHGRAVAPGSPDVGDRPRRARRHAARGRAAPDPGGGGRDAHGDVRRPPGRRLRRAHAFAVRHGLCRRRAPHRLLGRGDGDVRPAVGRPGRGLRPQGIGRGRGQHPRGGPARRAGRAAGEPRRARVPSIARPGRSWSAASSRRRPRRGSTRPRSGERGRSRRSSATRRSSARWRSSARARRASSASPPDAAAGEGVGRRARCGLA